MTPEQHRAHKKLLSSLPVREHKLPMCDMPARLGRTPGKPLVIDGEFYKNIKTARKTLKCGTFRIEELIGLGRAKYL